MRRTHVAFLALLAVVASAAGWFLHRPSATREVDVREEARMAEGRRAGALLEPTVEPIATPGAEPERTPAAPGIPVPLPEASSRIGLLRVLVLDKASGRPFEGVEVCALLDDGVDGYRVEATGLARGTPFQMLTTPVDGRVEIELPPSTRARVEARPESFAKAGPDQVAVPPLAAGEIREIVMRLPTGDDLPFWLQIVDETSGRPIVSAAVAVMGSDEDRTKLESDARGFVFCGGRTWQPAWLRVRAAGHSEVYVSPTPGHETAGTALVLGLPTAATLKVEVRDHAGAPVPDARVLLIASSSDLNSLAGLHAFGPEDSHYSASVDRDGTATLVDLPVRVPLTGSLALPLEWNASEPIVLEPGESRTVRWVIGRGVTLRGTVVDQRGQPVAQRVIWLRPAQFDETTIFDSVTTTFDSLERGSPRNTRTDDQGRFLFESVQPGRWWVGPAAPADLVVHRPADEVAALAQFVEIPSEVTDLDVAIRVDRGLFIRGSLLGADGKPARSGFVQCGKISTRQFHFQQLENGRNEFELGPLMAGTYWLSADGALDAPSRIVEVNAGSEGVELRLEPGARLEGRVLTWDGIGIEATVIVSSPDMQTVVMSSTAQGRFEFAGLPSGAYDLAASTSNGLIGVLEGVVSRPEAAPTDLAVQVTRGGFLQVRHEGPGRYAVIEVRQRGVLCAHNGAETGVSRKIVAPVGTVTVVLDWPGDARPPAEREVEVRAGETVDVVFEKGPR